MMYSLHTKSLVRLSSYLPLLLVVLFLYCAPTAAYAAIAVDVADTSIHAQAVSSSLSFSHTSTGSSLIGIACVEANSTTDTITATWAGSTMTAVQTALFSNGGLGTIKMFYIIAPTTGAQTVAFSDTAGQLFRGWSATYTGVNQSGQPDASLTNNNVGTGATETIATVANNSWTVLCNANNGGQPVAGTGSHALSNSGGAGFGTFDSNAAITPAGNYSMTWNGIPSAGWGDVEMSFSPVSAAVASTPIPGLVRASWMY